MSGSNCPNLHGATLGRLPRCRLQVQDSGETRDPDNHELRKQSSMQSRSGHDLPAVATADLLVVVKPGLKNDYCVSVDQVDKPMFLIDSP